jgi:hypothetical protein
MPGGAWRAARILPSVYVLDEVFVHVLFEMPTLQNSCELILLDFPIFVSNKGTIFILNSYAYLHGLLLGRF